jgi:hypothetical protein
MKAVRFDQALSALKRKADANTKSWTGQSGMAGS